MDEHQSLGEHRRFGKYLRKIRENRRLSLDAVEEMTLGYPEPVTKSHLSRIENGQAVPTFPRMFALSQIYGVPIASLAEKFEVDLRRVLSPAEIAGKSAEEILAELDRFKVTGRYQEALSLATSALEGLAAAERERSEYALELTLHQINCLVHLQRYESAKVECEELLSAGSLPPRYKLLALISFVNCCYRLQRYDIANMALEEVGAQLRSGTHPPRLMGTAEATRAAVYAALGDKHAAASAFENAARQFRSVPDPFETCKAQVNLAQVLIDSGELRKATTYLRKALDSAEKGGYDKLRALALSHLALVCFRQDDHESAEVHALRSNSIARPREYFSVVFRNCFYLRQVAASRGDEAAVNSNDRTLRTLLGRVESALPEAKEYRDLMTRIKR